MPQIETVVETALYAKNLDEIETFYGEALGLVVASKQPGRHIFFRVGRASMLLVFNPQATLVGDSSPSHGATGPGHVALGVQAESLESWRSRLEEKGVAIEKEVLWPRGGRSIYFRDPADNSVELVTPGVWGTAAGW
jgi:catechol 2,3-dioxygenase-like lactoylglutathione lyase family enzyme